MAFRASVGGEEVVSEPVVKFVGDVSSVLAALDALPEKADKAAKSTSNAFSTEFNKVSAAGAAMASSLGGPLGRIGSLANSALRPIAEVGGALGLIGAAAGGVALTAGAVKYLAESTVAAADRLHDLGIEIGPTQEANLAAYKAATKDLGIAFDELEVAVGGELVGDLAKVASAAAGTIRAMEQLGGWLASDREEIELFARAGLAILTLGSTEAARAAIDWAAANNDAEVSLEGLTDKEKADLQAKQDEKDAQIAIAIGTYQQAKADREAAEAKDAAAKATKAATEAEKASAEDSARTRAEMLAANDDAIAANKAEAESRKAQLDHEAKWFHDYSAQLEQEEKAVTNTISKETKKRTGLFKNMTDQQVANTNKSISAATSEFGALAKVTDSYAELQTTIAESYQARVDAGEALSLQEVKQANAAVDAAEGAAIAAAGIQAAVAAASAIASLQISGVPPPIAIPTGIAEGVGLFAATVAGIRSHQPPHFTWNPPGSTNGHNGPTGQDAVDTDGDGVADTAGVVAAKGGHVGTGTNERSGGGEIGLNPQASKLLKIVRRSHKRDPRGGR